MACTYTYKGKEYSKAEFQKLLGAGEFQRLAAAKYVTIPGTDFYQLDKTQAGVVDRLLKMHEAVQPNDDKTYLVNGKPVKRVTSVIKERQRKKFGAAADKATQDMWEEARATGEKIHSFNQDIINRLFNRPAIVDPLKLSVNETMVYNHMEKYITDLVALKMKAGSVFYAEMRIADPSRNRAGTVDLIEIEPSGDINIYDYKTRSKEALHKIKLDEYSQQLKEYADILEKTLETDVLKRRIVPIKISRTKNGEMTVDIKGQEPVALEKTGVEEFDTLLDKLHSRLDYLESQTVAESAKLAHKEKIENVQKSIKAIQLQRDLTTAMDVGLDGIERIINDLNNGTFDLNTDLRESHDLLNLYKEFDNYVPDYYLVDQDVKDRLAVLIQQARQAEKKLKKAEKDFLVQNGEKYGVIGTEGTQTIRDFLSPVKELGKWDRWFQGASFSEHPIIQTLRRSVEDKIVKTRGEFITIRDAVKEKQKAMFEYLGADTFEPLLQTYESGKRTGKLVDKVKPEYWIEAAKARTSADTLWFQTNSIFDSAKYTRDLNNYKKFISKSQKLDARAKEALVSKWTKDNQTNWYKYHTAKEAWYDPKWVDIQNKYKDTPVADFYNYYRTTMDSLVDELPIDGVYDTFIPNIQAGFLERAANAGLGNVMKSGFDFSFLEVLHEDPKYGKFDADNNPIDNIPILYTEELAPTDKSYDLGLLLTAFAGTSLNYKNLVDLEGLKEASLSFVRQQDELITTSKDEVRKTTSGQERKKPNPSTSSHYGQLKDYVDVVFYGRRRSQEKTGVFRNTFLDKLTAWSKGEEMVTEREYAWSKLFDSVLNFTAIKALGFNFFAPITNYLSGESTSFINGANGLYFNAGDKTKALGLLAANDQKAKLLIDKFNVKMGDFELDELKMLSTDKVKMGVSDVAFIGYHLGDYAVQNSNFIAMLLSNKHEIKWDDFDVVDGKLVDKTAKTDLDISRFRNKAMKVNKKIMGNMDKNDYASAKRYMLGRAVMQFRNWLPAMFEERWGRKRFDYDLEQWTEGRYRTGYKYVVEHVVLPMLGKTKSRLLEWKNLTPEQRAALKSNILDVVVIVGVVGLLGLLKGDDEPEDRTMLDRYSIRVLDRTLAELTFFTLLPLPNVIQDKYQIIISPAASVSTIEDVMRVWDHTVKKINAEERADPARAIKRLVPGINQITKLDEILSGKVQY
jgi:hypothetical protein